MDESSAKAAAEGSIPEKPNSPDLWLVNDDASQLLVQKRILGRFAWSVQEFLSPLEALAAARGGGSSRFLITDFHMPAMNGPELAELWCGLHADARVLIVSASELSARDQAAIESLPTSSVRLLTSYRITELLEQARQWFFVNEVPAGVVGQPSPVHEIRKRIDPSVLRKIGQLGGREFVARTVSRFLKSGPEKVERLRTAYAQKDYPAMHQLAHSLKGSCGIVGAQSLSEAIERIESATAEHGDLSELEQHVRQLGRECASTIEELTHFKL